MQVCPIIKRRVYGKYKRRYIKEGTKVVHKYGFNDVLQKPFEFIYDFGYYSATEGKCILYVCGCRNMQDSHVANIEDVRIAINLDLMEYTEGN